MATKYEQLIEYIINENEEKARELFHEIVVEKSREIYESIVDEEDLAETDEISMEEMTDEVATEEEAFAEGEDEENGGELDMGDEGSEDDTDMDMGDEEDHHADVGGEEELEGKVMDLEAELDELSAKFDELMSAEQEDGDMDDMDDMGDEGSEDMEMDQEEPVMETDEEVTEEEEVTESQVKEVKQDRKMTEAEWIREYVEKISTPSNIEEGDGKAGPVAGKNDMGGDAKNLAQGGEESGGKVSAPKVEDAGNKNVPGGKAGLDKAPAAKKAE